MIWNAVELAAVLVECLITSRLIILFLGYRSEYCKIWPCEKISVNSTTVIKNDIVGRLEKQPLNFFTVYNKYRNLSSFFNSQSTEMERSGMKAD